MGIAPFAHGWDRAGFGFVSRGTADYRIDRARTAEPEPGVQHYSARWDQEEARKSLRAQVMSHLASRDGVLVLEESEFVKESGQCVGTQRINGDAGRLEHRQTGVFLAYGGPHGSGYLDRELFLPRAWAEHRALRTASGVPSEVAYSTRPQMARRMIERALAHGVPHRFVAGGPAFGSDPSLREWLESRCEAYVLGVPERQIVHVRNVTMRAEALAATWPESAWARCPAAESAIGDEVWAGISLGVSGPASRTRAQSTCTPWERWLIACRRKPMVGECEYYLGYARQGASLNDMVSAIGAYRKIRQGFHDARETVGLDRFAGRSWDGWYRHITVALMAHTVLCMARDWGRDRGGKLDIPGDYGSANRPGWSRC